MAYGSSFFKTGMCPKVWPFLSLENYSDQTDRATIVWSTVYARYFYIYNYKTFPGHPDTTTLHNNTFKYTLVDYNTVM